ncbi:hypothetical protein Tsp_10909 [Trichinella spiralis]|uniref:hypothetical protein n=1 Tax=Trichinella spiralis TaxID=6334 RepID=UPI0001EFE97F|nr:hypothetical protein Tsp_10909 [Trichinella spiralis]
MKSEVGPLPSPRLPGIRRAWLDLSAELSNDCEWTEWVKSNFGTRKHKSSMFVSGDVVSTTTTTITTTTATNNAATTVEKLNRCSLPLPVRFSCFFYNSPTFCAFCLCCSQFIR